MWTKFVVVVYAKKCLYSFNILYSHNEELEQLHVFIIQVVHDIMVNWICVALAFHHKCCICVYRYTSGVLELKWRASLDT